MPQRIVTRLPYLQDHNSKAADRISSPLSMAMAVEVTQFATIPAYHSGAVSRCLDLLFFCQVCFAARFLPSPNISCCGCAAGRPWPVESFPSSEHKSPWPVATAASKAKSKTLPSSRGLVWAARRALVFRPPSNPTHASLRSPSTRQSFVLPPNTPPHHHQPRYWHQRRSRSGTITNQAPISFAAMKPPSQGRPSNQAPRRLGLQLQQFATPTPAPAGTNATPVVRRSCAFTPSGLKTTKSPPSPSPTQAVQCASASTIISNTAPPLHVSAPPLHVSVR